MMDHISWPHPGSNLHGINCDKSWDLGDGITAISSGCQIYVICADDTPVDTADDPV